MTEGKLSSTLRTQQSKHQMFWIKSLQNDILILLLFAETAISYISVTWSLFFFASLWNSKGKLQYIFILLMFFKVIVLAIFAC